METCKQFGWTYDEYLDAPLWFLNTVMIRNKVEAHFVDKENRKIKNVSRKK